MPNLLSEDLVIVGDILTMAGQVPKWQHGTVSRTDTTAKTLFTLPPGALVLDALLYGQTFANAGGTATVSAGFANGTGTELVNGMDVRAHGAGASPGNFGRGCPNVAGPQSAAVGVTAVYQEAGTPSTSGGPWTIAVGYLTF